MKILVYSIFRNSAHKIEQYYKQLKEVVEANPSCDFFLSIYENDSTDDTKSLLQQLDFSFFKEWSIVTEDLGTTAFSSVPEEERVKNLSAARNKAIQAKDFLSRVDYVLMVESDVRYSLECINNILFFKERNNLDNVDIVSAMLFQNEKLKLYDTWATRRDDKETWGHLHPNWKDVPYGRYYSTCNGICLFRAEVIRQGAVYDWYNKRLETFDCDTVVICEKYHELGCHDIFIDHTSYCYHK